MEFCFLRRARAPTKRLVCKVLSTAGSQLSQLPQRNKRPVLARELPAPGRLQVGRSQIQFHPRDSEGHQGTPVHFLGEEEA